MKIYVYYIKTFDKPGLHEVHIICTSSAEQNNLHTLESNEQEFQLPTNTIYV